MRQEIGCLVEEVDPQVVVLDAHMHVHAADDQPPHDVLQVLRQHVVAFLVGVVLALPMGERVRGRGDGREAELRGDRTDGRPQLDELIAGLLHRAADTGADLDLRTQEFGTDLARQGGISLGEERRRRLRGKVPGVLVDQEILFLHADAESGFLYRHGNSALAQRKIRLRPHCRTLFRIPGGQRHLDQPPQPVADGIGDARGQHADDQRLGPGKPP